MSSAEPPTAKAPVKRIAFAVAIALVAVNARPSLSSLGPVLPEALAATGLSRTAAGLLTTLPVLFLGMFGLLAPAISRRMGGERAILWLTLVLAAALGLRLIGTAPALVIGCAIGGAAIGTVNVLLPGLIKRDFSDRTALMMGVYTMALSGGATLGAGATAPLAAALGGWARGLAAWSLPALLAAIFWAVQMRSRRSVHVVEPPSLRGLWRDPLAWQITVFVGMQSALAYALFAWAPTMLRDRGFDPVAAGLVFSTSILVQIPAALVGPMLATRGRDQRPAIALTVGLSLVGVAGLLFAPLSQVWLWTVVMGLGQGALFAIALTVVVLRARDGREAAALSAMAQGFGYSLAAAAPLLAGLLRDLTGSWTASVVVMMAMGLTSGLFGMFAGRNCRLGATR